MKQDLSKCFTNGGGGYRHSLLVVTLVSYKTLCFPQYYYYYYLHLYTIRKKILTEKDKDLQDDDNLQRLKYFMKDEKISINLEDGLSDRYYGQEKLELNKGIDELNIVPGRNC